MQNALRRRLRRVVTALLMLLSLLFPAQAFFQVDRGLKAVRKHDFIQVFTRNTPTTYYEGRRGPTGFEYELVRRFADHLGVSLAINSQSNIEGVLQAVRQGQADLGAAALPLDPTLPGIRYSRAILDLQPLVVYRRGLPPPQSVEDLLKLDIGVISGSGASLVLREAQAQWPDLSWRETANLEVADLLEMVEAGDLDAAVIYAHQFKLNRLFFPGVENAFVLGEPLSLAWAFPETVGLGLLEEANRFLDTLQANGTLAQLIERYFGHDDYLEYVGARLFIQHVQGRLPKYAELFREAARNTGFDWKLLAALGYQESHWRPKATSPTGVRGLMMLTLPTAEQMGVDNRLDPRQSIDGGARYLRSIEERLQAEIPEPDRLWMALAAYNVGLGHLYDAQKIAEMRGGDPYAWADVREALPLLQKREWYSRVRHGYARGGEPVIYVRNIRRYYEILNYVDRSQQQFHQLDERQEKAAEDMLFDTVSPLL
ncbi:membrane-bound lytic murein transglycosylase MltF [Halomonas shantousis]